MSNRLKVFCITKESVAKYGGTKGIAKGFSENRYAKCKIDLDEIELFKKMGNICNHISIVHSHGCYVENSTLYNKKQCLLEDIVRIINVMPWIESLEIHSCASKYMRNAACRRGLKRIHVTGEVYNMTSFNNHLVHTQADTLVVAKGFTIIPSYNTFQKLIYYHGESFNLPDVSTLFPQLTTYIAMYNDIYGPLPPHLYNIDTRETRRQWDIHHYIHVQKNQRKWTAIKCFALCMLRVGISKDMRRKIIPNTYDLDREHWAFDHLFEGYSGNIHWSTKWDDVWEARYKKWADIKSIEQDIKDYTTEQQAKLRKIAKHTQRVTELQMLEKEAREQLKIKKQKV